MKNQEIRILLDDKKTVILVDNQVDLIKKIKTKDVHSITIYGDVPAINISETSGNLHFMYSDINILLIPQDLGEGFQYNTFKRFMTSIKSMYTPGTRENFATTLGFPSINEAGRLTVDPVSVLFHQLGNSGMIENARKTTEWDQFHNSSQLGLRGDITILMFSIVLLMVGASLMLIY